MPSYKGKQQRVQSQWQNDGLGVAGSERLVVREFLKKVVKWSEKFGETLFYNIQYARKNLTFEF